jgi:hypothetical protein
MSISAHLPTNPMQWLEPKQAAAQVSPIYAATCLPKTWLRNLKFSSSIFLALQTSNFKLEIIIIMPY